MAQDVESRILLRAGNTRPDLEVTLTDELGRPVSLDAADTVEVVVVDWTGTELWRNAAVPDPDQDANTGQVSYQWRQADTATAGNYGLFFHVTYDTGDTGDFPTSGPLDFVVAEPGTADLDPFLVPVDRLARRIGITDLTDDLRDVIEDMEADVQADVEGYLRRPVVPIRVTETAPRDITDPSGWRLAWDPLVRILSTSGPDANGLFTVSYVAGITNPIAQRAIARYVSGATVEEFRAHPVYGRAYRAVRTVSAGGRSLTYDQPAGANRRASAQLPAYPQPGSMPSIETLAAWRRRGVFSRIRYAGTGVEQAGIGGIGIALGSGVYTFGDPGAAGSDGLFYGNPVTGEVFPA